MANYATPNSNDSTGHELKPGYLTTEFWVTVASLLLAIAGIIFHKDLSSQGPVIGGAFAGIATIVYTLSRAWTKSSYVKAATVSAGDTGIPPASPVPDANRAARNGTPPSDDGSSDSQASSATTVVSPTVPHVAADQILAAAYQLVKQATPSGTRPINGAAETPSPAVLVVVEQ